MTKETMQELQSFVNLLNDMEMETLKLINLEAVLSEFDLTSDFHKWQEKSSEFINKAKSIKFQIFLLTGPTNPDFLKEQNI